MSVVCRAENLAKAFKVPMGRRTALGMVRRTLGGRSLRQDLWVLRDIDLEIRSGEKIALLGKNGSGKTTLLRILAGIFEKSSGSLSVSQEPQVLFRSAVGFMPDLPVEDNVLLFGAIHGITRDSLRRRMSPILETCELVHLAQSPLKELSVGQTQRLALVTFFEATGSFLLFDEVISNLDVGFVRRMEERFRELARSDKTVIMTSHDPRFLKTACTTALWLENGRIRMSGAIDSVLELYEESFDNEGHQ